MVLDRYLCAVLLRQIPLLRGRGRCDCPRAHRLQELAEPESHSSRCGRDEDPVAFLHRVGFADESNGRKSLKQRRGRDFRIHRVWDGDRGFRRDGRVLCVCVLSCVRYAGAELEIGRDVGSQRRYGTAALPSEDIWRVGQGVDAGAEVTISI